VKLRELFDRQIASFRSLLVDGFVSAIENETLSERQLGIYLAQDIHYLKALAHTLGRMRDAFTDVDTRNTLGRHRAVASKSCSEMRRLFVEVPELAEMAADPVRPTTYAYINHQRLSLERGIRAGLWSLLPCYLFYPTFVYEVKNCKTKRAFIRKWRESLPKYDGTILWKHEIEEVFARVNPRRHDRALEKVFSISKYYEVMFLRMAYNDESWLPG
jgi:thiaminase